MKSLHMEQGFALTPKILQAIIIPSLWRKDVQDNFAKIEQHPPVLCQAFYAGIKLVFRLDLTHCRMHQPLDHPIAATGTNDEIIGKNC